MTPKPKLYRVTAPHFVAGFIHEGRQIKTAAPILGWLKGQPLKTIEHYARVKDWKLEEVPASDFPVSLLTTTGRVNP